MKKLFALILVLIMVLSLAACGGNKGDAVAGGNTEPSNNTTGTSNTTENTSQDTTGDTSENTGGETTENTPNNSTPENNSGNNTGNNTGNDSGNNSGNQTATHTHNYATQVIAPTCTTSGYTIYACSCGDTYTANQTAVRGHFYNQTVVAPTCTEQGYTKYACACGNSYNADYTNPKGHMYSQKVTAATCTAQGYTTYTCACGHSYVGNYTNASHSYSKYVCTKCGAVDKAHAYEYLMEWVKANGTREGENICYTIDSSNNATVKLSYSLEFNNVYVDYFTQPTSYSTAYAQLHLDDYFYGFSFYGDTIYGYVDARRYTRDSSLTYVQAECYTYDIERMLSAGKTTIDILLLSLKNSLRLNNLPITLADLGFTSF